MPEPKRPLKVFLCHASTDKPKVRELYRYLKRRGIQPWFDEEDLVGGQDWQIEIPKALATSDAIIICLTKNSVDKEGYVQNEIKFALDKALSMPEGRIFLIPVKFEDCEVPFSLSRYQWVDLTVEAGYSKMMKALKFRASQLERTTVEIPKKDAEEKLLFAAESLKKQERDSAEKAEKEKQERELAEKHRREKIDREAAEKARQEKPKVEKGRKEAPNRKKGNRTTFWISIFAIPIVGIVLFFIFKPPPSEPDLTPSPTSIVLVPSSTARVQPSQPPLPSKTLKPSQTPTVTQVVNVTGSKKTSPKDGAIMVYISSLSDVNSFWIDQSAINASQFEKFVSDTNYQTDAEKNGVGYVWTSLGEIPSSNFPGQVYQGFQWKIVSGADWRNPLIESAAAAAGIYKQFFTIYDNQVLQVSWNDAKEYCQWAGRDLVTTVEWELAKKISTSVVFYDRGQGLGEWGSDKTSGDNRIILGFKYVDFIGNYPFDANGFSENRSGNIITFRCKSY